MVLPLKTQADPVFTVITATPVGTVPAGALRVSPFAESKFCHCPNTSFASEMSAVVAVPSWGSSVDCSRSREAFHVEFPICCIAATSARRYQKYDVAGSSASIACA